MKAAVLITFLLIQIIYFARAEQRPDVDCYTGYGLNYRGHLKETRGGHTCKKWTGTSYTGAKFSENYCRGTTTYRPWCYYDDDKHWQYCSVPECNDCGRVFSNSTGVLTSRGWPAPYGKNIDCAMGIHAVDGYVIKLSFTHLDIEGSGTCRFDYIQVRDGALDSSPLIGRYCGTTVPAVTESSTSDMYLNFHSDGSNQGSGFRVHWVAIPKPVYGQWSSWSGWSACSVGCGGGSQSRSRAPCQGSPCQGSSTQDQTCNTQACDPVPTSPPTRDGFWTGMEADDKGAGCQDKASKVYGGGLYVACIDRKYKCGHAFFEFPGDGLCEGDRGPGGMMTYGYCCIAKRCPDGRKDNNDYNGCAVEYRDGNCEETSINYVKTARECPQTCNACSQPSCYKTFRYRNMKKSVEEKLDVIEVRQLRDVYDEDSAERCLYKCANDHVGCKIWRFERYTKKCTLFKFKAAAAPGFSLVDNDVTDSSESHVGQVHDCV